MVFIAKSALAALVLAMASSVDASKLKNIVYYQEWSYLVRQFGIFDMDWDKITHINYAYAKPTADGTVAITLVYESLQKRLSIKAIRFKKKKQFRGTKLGLSIGGWTLSEHFSSIASTEQGRANFAKSSVKLVSDLGLDFIDVDWTFPVEGEIDVPSIPHRPDDAQNYVLLLKAIRDEMKTLPFKAELSVASPALLASYRHWDFGAICGQLDHINVLAYDFAGTWSNYTEHQANLHEDPNHPGDTKYSAHGAIQDYIKGGCPSEKIVFGVPSIGTSFEKTNGLYSNFTKPSGSNAGRWDYKVLPRPGATEYFDEKVGAAYSYDPASKVLVSYESPASLALKLSYVKQYNLGGALVSHGWADAAPNTARSLISQVYNTFGRANMAFNDNNLNYPTSPYENIRNISSPTTTNAPTTTRATPSPTPSTTTKAPTTHIPTKDKCDGNRNTCYWPANRQVLPYSQADCKLFYMFLWCP